MNKSKAKFLFTLICALLVTLITMTFIRFTVGTTDYNSILGAVSLDYDIGGGYSYEVSLTNVESDSDEEIMKAISKRLDYLDFKGYTVKAVKRTDNQASQGELNSKYVIYVPASMNEYGKDDVALLTDSINAVLRHGELEIFHGTSNDVSTKLEIEDEYVESVKYLGMQETVYGVSVKFTEEAWNAILAAESAATETFALKIILGDLTLINGTFSSQGFTDRTIYLEDTTEAGARQKALQIGLGGLEYKFNIPVEGLEAVKVNALLGENTETILSIAVGIITLAIIVALFVFFKGFGIITMITMLAFIYGFTAMLVAVPGIVLSVPGVIGMIITLFATGAMLFASSKRVAEEYSKGKTVRSAIKTAFNAMFKTVLSACVIMAVCGLALFIFTSGTTACLGITLGIGAVISFIATTLLARLLANCMVSFVGNPEVLFQLKRTEE